MAETLLPCTCHSGDEPYCPRHTPLLGEHPSGSLAAAPLVGRLLEASERLELVSSGLPYRPDFAAIEEAVNVMLAGVSVLREAAAALEAAETWATKAAELQTEMATALEAAERERDEARALWRKAEHEHHLQMERGDTNLEQGLVQWKRADAAEARAEAAERRVAELEAALRHQVIGSLHEIRRAAFAPEIGVRYTESIRLAIADECRKLEDAAAEALAAGRDAG